MYDNRFAREEFIGKSVRIVKCSDPSWIGKQGLILDETKNTFLIEIENKEKRIAKNTAIFEFKNHDKKIMIDGTKIMFRPEDRIKKIR